MWQIIPISPASVKRLADFDKEVLILNPKDNYVQGRVNWFQIENEIEDGTIEDGTIEDVARMDEKEGEAIKMAESQKNLTEASPSREVSDGGRDSSKSARSEIPSGVGIAQVCSGKPCNGWLMIPFKKLSTVTQTGPKIGTPLELSNIANTFGVSPRGSSDTAVVVLAHQSTPADTTTSNILDLRLRASLAANDIISVTRTQGHDGFRLVWIEFRSPDHARRFRHAALSHGGAPFFCEQVYQILFDAVRASPGSDSKEWVDPKGSRRKRRKKVKPLI